MTTLRLSMICVLFVLGMAIDSAAYDQSTHLVFSSNGEGTLTIIKQVARDQYTVLETVPTHRIYLSTAEFGPPPAPTTERPHPRPTIVPGSFTVLVLDR